MNHEGDKKSWCKRRVRHWWFTMCEHHSRHDLSDSCPRVEFSRRMTRAAGIAYSGRNLVKFSTIMLLAEGEKFDETIGHEVAHVFADRHHMERCNHGPKWKAVMRSVGLPPTRCHEYASAHHTKFACPCGFQGLIGPRQLSNFLLGKRWYACAKCGQEIQKEYLKWS